MRFEGQEANWDDRANGAYQGGSFYLDNHIFRVGVSNDDGRQYESEMITNQRLALVPKALWVESTSCFHPATG